MARFAPSPYQVAILDWLKNDSGNLAIIATAGSGKTSTLELLAREMPRNANPIFLAFNKSIATELSERLPFPASTFHALCFKALGKNIVQETRSWPKVDGNKVNGIIDRLYGRQCAARSVLVRLVSLAKNENVSVPSDEFLCEMVARHDIDVDSALEDNEGGYTKRQIFNMVRDILVACTKELRTVDFDDMIWLVEVRNVKLDVYSHILVDEAQDTNPLQRALLRRIMSPTSRLIVVGDHAQAIYGFRGASNDALGIIAQEFGTKELPLTVSYRCPVSVVNLASRYGVIESAPNAIQGTVTTAPTYKLTDFQPNDLVLCRNTAPLVTVAYKLLARRIPAQIRGRDIGVSLKNLITKLSGRRGTLETLPDKVAEYQSRETALALEKRQESKAQSIADKCESILALIDSMTQEDVEDGIPGLLSIIDTLFDDRDGRGKVLLSTIHKAKGLEAKHVKILDWHLCPSKYAKQDWQRTQEKNLQFVAITRSQDTLTFVKTETLTD